MVDNALGSALRLRPLAGCADVRALRAAYEPVGDDKRAAVDALRHDVADVVARYNAGRCQEAMPLATEVAARAKSVGYVPVEAEAATGPGGRLQPVAIRRCRPTYPLRGGEGRRGEPSRRARGAARWSCSRRFGAPDCRSTGRGRRSRTSPRRPSVASALPTRSSPSSPTPVDGSSTRTATSRPLFRSAARRSSATVAPSGTTIPTPCRCTRSCRISSSKPGTSSSRSPPGELLARSVELLGAGHQRTGRYTLDVAETLVVQGKYEEAAPWLDRARPIVAGGPREHSGTSRRSSTSAG